jgi:hypothetical protein
LEFAEEYHCEIASLQSKAVWLLLVFVFHETVKAMLVMHDFQTYFALE